MYQILYSAGVAEDLRELRAYDRSAILDKIEKQLQFLPLVETRNRKPLPGFVPPWIGQYRVYYDVNEEERIVSVGGIRRKRPTRQPGRRYETPFLPRFLGDDSKTSKTTAIPLEEVKRQLQDAP